MTYSSSTTIGNTTAITETQLCCPRFDPAPWQEKEIRWDRKKFVTGHVRSLVHIPLNYSSVLRSLQEKIVKAEAMDDRLLTLSDERSLWGSDLFIAVTKDVPGCDMTELSGTFLTKVFEGPYRDAGKWAQEMGTFVRSQGKTLLKLYFFYTTCPTCAGAYGKNYTVLLAQVA